MSRGPGSVERAIRDLFRMEPSGAFTTEELCESVFGAGVTIEKKHRVSVLRAARRIVNTDADWRVWSSETMGGSLVFFNMGDVISYSLARLKSDTLHQYRSKRAAAAFAPLSYPMDEQQLRDLIAPGGNKHSLITPGGAWWRHVEIHKAERDGDQSRAAEIQAKLDADIRRSAARLGVCA